MKKYTIFFYMTVFSLFFVSNQWVLAQNIPAQQEAGGIESRREAIDTQKLLQKQIITSPKKTVVEEKEVIQPEPEVSGISQKVTVSTINVTGAVLLTPKEIDSVTQDYKNREISVRDMRELANKITDLYRQKGFITSRAYLPPQRIENDVLEVVVVEGLMGEIDVRGNRWFKSSLIKRKIAIKEGRPFNYNVLRQNLSLLNEKPDRNVRTVLTPGKKRGTTDLVLNVEDTMPIHIGFRYDNFASRYIEKYRGQVTLTHNNLLGFDDILTLQWQASDESVRQYQLTSLRYLFPLTNRTDVGFYVGETQLTLGKEFENLLARGKSDLISVFVNHDWISKENLDIKLTAGFDYKDVYNFQLGVESSRDRQRSAKLGINIDRTDTFGRTILNNDVSFGVPGLWGGLEKVDSKSSRLGAGGKFVKNLTDFLRLHQMPWNSNLLLKGQNQWASRTLTAAEQYQIGGIANVRAYPPGEFSGDNGQSFTAEWTFPPYVVPRGVKYPFTDISVYDSFKLATFYDWGRVETRTPTVGSEESTILSGAGAGVRVNLPGDYFVRVDVAWPLTARTASDDSHFRTWFQITKEF